MNLNDVKTVVSDIRTAYILSKNNNYKERLYEAYEYLKQENVESLEDFESRKGLKIGAFTYYEVTIFDRLKDEEYKKIITNAFHNVNNIECVNNPSYGDDLASWGTLGYTPKRDYLIKEGYITHGLTEEEMNKKI